MEEKIIEGAEALFMRYGIKSVTMDDVARELGISKKTLYQYYTDKKVLVDKALENHLNKTEESCKIIIDQNTNPIDLILNMSSFHGMRMRNINPSLLYDLKKYYTESWQRIVEYKFSFVFAQMSAIIDYGKKLGLFREELNTPIVVKLHMAMFDLIVDRDLFNIEETPYEIIHNEMIMYHLHGICTKAGINYLNEKIK